MKMYAFCLLLLLTGYPDFVFSQRNLFWENQIRSMLPRKEQEMNNKQLSAYKTKQIRKLKKVLHGGIWDEIIPNLVYVPMASYINNFSTDDSLKVYDKVVIHVVEELMLNTEVTNKMYRYFLMDSTDKRYYPQFGNDTVTGASQLFKEFKLTIRGKTYTVSEYLELDDYPVIGVSWKAANAFCNWLSKKQCQLFNETHDSSLLIVGGFRLSSEAGFEKASVFNEMPDNYNEIGFNSIIKYKIFPGHKKEEINFGYITSTDSTTSRDSEKDGYKYTNPVKAFHPGKLGLYGLQGNASEWQLNNPITYSHYNLHQYPDNKIFRVVKGGSWFDGPLFMQPMERQIYKESSGSERIGFRVCANFFEHPVLPDKSSCYCCNKN